MRDILQGQEYLDNQKSRIQTQFIQGVVSALILLVIAGLPMSLIRVYTTGLHFIHLAHIAVSVLILVLYISRNHIKESTLAWLCILLFFILSAVSFFQYGLASAGFYMAAAAIIVASVYFGLRKGIMLSAALMTMMAISAYTWITGIRTFPYDPDRYFLMISPWMLNLFAFFIVSFILFLSTSIIQDRFRDLIDTVSEHQNAIELLATHDSLTGLPSRRLIMDRLEMALRNAHRTQSRVGVLYIDLDSFKPINDTFGHECGDSVLREVARRLSSVLREGDTAGRIGGDEFILVLPNIADGDSTSSVCRRIISELGKELEAGGNRVTVGASVGVAIFPDNSEDSCELIKIADMAMYKAKESGKNNFCVAETRNTKK